MTRHSTVFELASRPIPADQQATPGYLPDWFFGSVADYAARMSTEEREESIAALAKHLGHACTRRENRLTLLPQFKQSYFQENHRYFKAAAEALSETDYETFAGMTPAPAFYLALNGLQESYEDKRGFYVYSRDENKLLPLDSWLRRADLSKPFFVGGTIDYHC